MKNTTEHLKNGLEAKTTDELYALVYTDSLTGSHNRRAFDEDARPFVAIVDLDSLKYVNDTYGHRWGDHMLVNLAAELVLQFGHDNVYRLSGDEFAIKSRAPLDEDCFDDVLRVFPAFSYGTGRDVVAADTRLRTQKEVREGLGLRAARGERPPWACDLEVKHGLEA